MKQIIHRFDGSFGSLVDVYKFDSDSPIHEKRHSTRKTYIKNLNKLLRMVKRNKWLSHISMRHFKRWHEEMRWPDGREGADHVSGAHAAMTMFRILLTFGVAMEYPHCDRLKAILDAMTFPNGKPRTQELTAAHAVAIRGEAHRQGHHSIALAQALQFELTLRQKDVIGEWVPEAEHGPTSDLVVRRKKWLYGARWDEIDRDYVLRHPVSKSSGAKIAIFDLQLYPMVMEELARVPVMERTGPIVKCERTVLPWKESTFCKKWREIARAAKVPDEIRNMDSRAGGITEASDAMGDDMEAVRIHAQHSDSKTTQRYSRGNLRKTSRVATMRAAARDVA